MASVQEKDEVTTRQHLIKENWKTATGRGTAEGPVPRTPLCRACVNHTAISEKKQGATSSARPAA